MSQGQPARDGQDGLAYTLGGRILAAASRVGWCVEAPTAHEAIPSARPLAEGTQQHLGHPPEQ